jgi:hypothetical protein
MFDSYCPIITMTNWLDIPVIILVRMRSNTIDTKIGIPALPGDKLSRERTYKPMQFFPRRKTDALFQSIRLFTKRV